MVMLANVDDGVMCVSMCVIDNGESEFELPARHDAAAERRAMQIGAFTVAPTMFELTRGKGTFPRHRLRPFDGCVMWWLLMAVRFPLAFFLH